MYRGPQNIEDLKEKYGSAFGALVRDAIRVEKVKELLLERKQQTKVYTMNKQEKTGNDSCPTHIAGLIDVERNDLLRSGITFKLLHFDYLHMTEHYLLSYLLKGCFFKQVLPSFIENNVISTNGEIW
jgi:hypothetical protein